MTKIVYWLSILHGRLDTSRAIDFLGPLALRLYLVPVFWMAGTHKLDGFDGIVDWFGNDQWGLGLPFPLALAVLATATELVGAIFLAIGFATRYIAVPLMFTMIIAIGTVHWQYGWQAIADTGAPFATERVMESSEKLAEAKTILKQHGDYSRLTSSGNFVVLNNGIEFGATYLIMLLMLFFSGAGRFASVDYWIHRRFLVTE